MLWLMVSGSSERHAPSSSFFHSVGREKGIIVLFTFGGNPAPSKPKEYNGANRNFSTETLNKTCLFKIA